MAEVVVTAFARTPFGRFGGGLATLSTAELGAVAIDRLLERDEVRADAIDALYAGIGMMAGATITPVRQAVLMSALPETVPSLMVDRACCSGMTTVGLACKEILSGAGQTLICGGFENLSQTPRLSPRSSPKIGAVTLYDPLLLKAPVVDRQIAVYTGDESLAHGISRQAQDAWALSSHRRYHEAQARGFFAAELVAIEVPGPSGATLIAERDESPRSDTTMERLAALPTIYGSATITAGNAPGLNDGAALLLLSEAKRAKALGMTPLARIVGYAQVAAGRTSGVTTPALAIRAALDRCGLNLEAIDLFEINEAYAATPLVSTSVMADQDHKRMQTLLARTNVNGGAVAIGHPVGASGARLVMTLIAALRARGGGLGAAAICGGFGQGDAVIVEVAAEHG
jgi:acetyl-CoA C-acetyltransferase